MFKPKFSSISMQCQFRPPYCPNSQCSYHSLSTEDRSFYCGDGWQETSSFPFKNRRFKCKRCGKKFSYNTFQLNYRKRLDSNLYDYILHHSVQGLSNRSMARFLKVAEGSVRARIALLSRQAILQMRVRERDLIIKEEIVYDGFETFQYSQYDPCHVNTAVGKDSFFQYDLNYAPLNRKGCMTPAQKLENDRQLEIYGKYPSDAIEEKTIILFKRLLLRSKNGLLICCDKHSAYQRAADKVGHSLRLSLTSSKELRDASNPLFAINHLHFTYRQHTAAHQRQTCSFHKNEAGLMDRMILFQLFKNYMVPRFVRKNAFIKNAHTESPAMALKLVDKLMSVDEFYSKRLMSGHAELSQDDYRIYYKKWEFSRRKIISYRE